MKQHAASAEVDPVIRVRSFLRHAVSATFQNNSRVTSAQPNGVRALGLRGLELKGAGLGGANTKPPGDFDHRVVLFLVCSGGGTRSLDLTIMSRAL